MSRSQIQYGSQGDDVKYLQETLNKNGYNLTVDGIFGTNTQNAVKEYQKKYGLTVDGIVGNNTWASLTGGSTPTATDSGFQYKDFTYDKSFTDNGFSYGDYKESEVVTDAKNALDTQLANKPGEYTSQWQTQLDDVINKILNREKFSYDLNGDALYQQYKDKYTNQAKMAMGDAIGQASAMTGGYGNSYAQSVGQQMYQKEMQNLNDIVPELYQMAYDKYNQEGQDMYNQYAMLGDRENMDYGRYRDSVSDWMAERDYLTGRYDSERNFDYSKYADDRNFEYNKYADDRNFAYGQYIDDKNFEYGKYADDKNYAYNEYRNAIEDEKWQKEFDEAKRQYDEQMALTKQEYDNSSKSYSGTTSSGANYNNGSLTNGQVKELQAALGVTADGYYGSVSKEAAGGLSASEAYAKYVGGYTGNDNTGNNPTTNAIPDSVHAQAAKFESNEDLAAWAYSLEDSGVIAEGQAAQLISQYYDHNEKTTTGDDGTSRSSYRDMVGSTKGWSVESNGGGNLVGIDANAKVKSPNGEIIRLDQLREKLIAEGMSKNEATNAIKKLQQNLGISSNWLFGW